LRFAEELAEKFLWKPKESNSGLVVINCAVNSGIPAFSLAPSLLALLPSPQNSM
jgi:hypothetical protein